MAALGLVMIVGGVIALLAMKTSIIEILIGLPICYFLAVAVCDLGKM